MRIDQSESVATASDIVNWASRGRLEGILRTLGDEPHAKIIVDAIISHRKDAIISSSRQLSDLISNALWKLPAVRAKSIHPATRTFQALRMAVNDELAHITNGLRAGFELLRVGGLLATVCFHAIEDKLVKSFMSQMVDGNMGSFAEEKFICPSLSEIAENPSSRSAKLRMLVKKTNTATCSE